MGTREWRQLGGLALLALLAVVTAGCDKLGIGSQAPVADEAPTDQELKKISYLSSAGSGPNGRKLYTRFEEARSCGDFELAMRWNRPPGLEGGPFHQKMVYVRATLPADLPKNTEVFIRATIQEGETLRSGSARWYLRMQDGTLVEAVEDSGFMEKQEQAAQESQQTALVAPNKPGRAFCGHGIYQGVAGKDPTKDEKIPLVSVLYAMDRDSDDTAVKRRRRGGGAGSR
jgi:hypothetical protein